MMGTIEPGLWLLPLPTVAMSTVALGLFLVHRAEDVVSGATVSLRILPAVLTCSGLAAWLIGNEHPLIGASVPIGGALIAAGNTWSGIAPPLIASASSLTLTAGLLAYTANHIEQLLPLERPLMRGLAVTGVSFITTAFCWWTPVIGPLLWATGGNPQLTRDLAPEPGIAAGTLGLALIGGLYLGRSKDITTDFQLRAPPFTAWIWGLAIGLCIALCAPSAALMPVSEHPFYGHASLRMAAALNPTWCGILLFSTTVVVQELVFRGWLQHRVGPLLSTLVFCLVLHPLNPIRILPAAALLAVLTHNTRSVYPAIIARFAWGYTAIAVAPIGPEFALTLSLLAPVALWAVTRDLYAPE
jgi:hypothetical protein